MAVGDKAVCAYDKCKKEFIKTTHNQKYHDNECCRLATSEKAMAKYYEKKSRRGGAKRVCEGPSCHTLLSRYNEDKLCAKCMERQNRETNKKLLDLIT